MKDDKKLILVADDELEIRDIVRLLLTGDGYLVETVENGRQAVEQMSGDVDLCILDVNMPELSGILAADKIRRQFDTPIIFLTAYSSESDKVMGFSVGADDYIVKPFSNVELLMRVKAILRRSERFSHGKAAADGLPSADGTSKAAGGGIDRHPANQISLGDLFLDLDSQSVIKGEDSISLTYTEFKILELLASHKKKIYSLENIYQSIWEDDVVSDSAIMVHIKNIRKKLGDSSRNPVYIKTAWGRGYYID